MDRGRSKDKKCNIINNNFDAYFAAHLHSLDDTRLVHTLLGAPLELPFDREMDIQRTDCYMLFLFRAARFFYGLRARLNIAPCELY